MSYLSSISLSLPARVRSQRSLKLDVTSYLSPAHSQLPVRHARQKQALQGLKVFLPVGWSTVELSQVCHEVVVQ